MNLLLPHYHFASCVEVKSFRYDFSSINYASVIKTYFIVHFFPMRLMRIATWEQKEKFYTPACYSKGQQNSSKFKVKVRACCTHGRSSVKHSHSTQAVNLSKSICRFTTKNRWAIWTLGLMFWWDGGSRLQSLVAVRFYECIEKTESLTGRILWKNKPEKLQQQRVSYGRLSECWWQ